MKKVPRLILCIVVLMGGSALLFWLELRSRHDLFLSPLYSYLVQFVTYFLLGLLAAPTQPDKDAARAVSRALGLLSLIILVLPLIPLTYLGTVRAFVLHTHLAILSSFVLGCVIRAEHRLALRKREQ